MIYTFPCQPPDICRHLSVVKSNILIRIIPSSCTKQKQWHQTFMTLWPGFMPSCCEAVCVRCVPHFINRKLFILKKRQIGFPIFHPKARGEKIKCINNCWILICNWSKNFGQNKWFLCPGNCGGILRITIKIRSPSWNTK